MSNEVDIVAAQQSGATQARTQQEAAALQAAAQARANADLARANAQLARDLARTQVRDAIRDANAATELAGAPQPPTPPNAPLPPGLPSGNSPTIVIPTDGGDNININVDGSGIHVSQNGHETVIPIRDVVPHGVVQMTYAVCASLAFVIVGFPIALAFSRWLNRRGTSNGQSAQLSAAVQQRLDTMDRNIDTVAMELERVSEGQRFTAKLLAERGQMPAPEYVAAGARAPIDRSHG